MPDAPRSPVVRPDPPNQQQAVLIALRRIGPATPDALAAELRTTRSAALSRLRMLESAGLVSRGVERHGVGRPRHRYDLTDAAQSLMPANYAGLAVGLIEALEAVADPSLVTAVFAERRRREADLIRERFTALGLDDGPLLARVRELAVIQDEHGYVCECVAASETADIESGQMHMRQANCAIFDVAQDHPAACEAELDLFRDVLGVEVTREAHIVAGDRTCTYRVEPGNEV